MNDKPQIWDVPISHAERFELFSVAFSKDTTVDSGPEGKKYRRMARAFGLSTIRDAARKNEGALPVAVLNSPEKRLFKVTAENVEIVLTKLAKIKRSLGSEMILGELFDRLEIAQAHGQEPADAARRDEWLTVPVFDPDAEAALWTPPSAEIPGALTCPSCAQEFTLDEARASHAAAHPANKPAPESDTAAA